MKLHRGEPFGSIHIQRSFRTGIKDPDFASWLNSPEPDLWILSDGDIGIMLSGLGLEPDVALLRHDPAMPPRKTSSLRPNTGINVSPRGSITLVESSCVTEPERFPDCGGYGKGKQEYNIYYFNQATGPWKGLQNKKGVLPPTSRFGELRNNRTGSSRALRG